MTTNIHVDFRLDGNSASFGMSGFAEPEKIGTWMIGDTSTLSLPLPTSDSGPRSDEKRRFDISFSVIPELVPGIVETQRLQIIVNDRLALDARIGGPAELQCVIDNDSIGVSSNVEVKFKHPDGIRPLDHGRRDARVLSICLSSLSMREHDDPPADNDNAGSSLPVFDEELLASDLKSIGCRTEVPFPVFGERPVWRSLRSTESPTPLRPLAVENTVWTDEWVISMHRKGSPTIPVQISAYFLRDALVFGHGYVAVRGVLVTCPDVMPAYVKSGIKNGSYDLSSFAKLPLRTIEEPCIVYAGWGVSIYGHVLIEFIPKLHILLSANVLGETRPRLLVQDDIPEWHLAMLSVQFGLTREDFIFFEPQAERILLHQAIVPTLLSRPDGFLPATQDSILAGITACKRVSGRHLPTRLYLSRSLFRGSHTRAREFIGEHLISRIAADEFGFTIVSPEQLAWPEQVSLFASATAIVGEFGSALHAAMYSQPGTRILSIVIGNITQSYIAALCGHDMAYLRVSGQLSQRFSVDATEFREIMAAHFGEQPPLAGLQPARWPMVETASFYWPTESSRPPPRPPTDVPTDFDDEAYLRMNADVREFGMDPRVHYLHHGWHEKRRWKAE